MKLITSIAGIAFLLQAPISSAQSPTLVRDFYPGELTATLLNHGGPHGFRIQNDRLLLFANDGPTAGKLFALNDLSGNVEELAHVGNVVGYTHTNGGIITNGDKIFFFTQVGLNSALNVVSNGTVEQLALLPYEVMFYHTMIPLFNGKVIFPGHDEAHGWEPWITDGTVQGTVLLKDIAPGSASSLGSPFPLFQGFDFAGYAYFLASDGTNGMQLWKSQGYESNTEQFVQINDPGETGAIMLEWSMNAEHFIVSSNEGIVESNGSMWSLMHPSSAVQVKIPGHNCTVSPTGGWMYFLSSESPWRLYRTKGTTATTETVLDASVPQQTYPYLAEMNGMLYAFGTSGNLIELRRLDPVTRTATVVKTFSAITNGSGSNQNFYGFRVLGDYLYFFGIEGDHHRQYWRSDGTEAGTVMISNFQPTVVNGGPNPSSANMIAFQDHFVFTANSEVVGAELFAAQGVVGIAETAKTNSSIDAWVDGSGTLVIQSTEQLGTVRVLDVTGREAARKDQVHGEVRIPLGQQSAGFYLIRSEHQGQVRQTKVMLD